MPGYKYRPWIGEQYSIGRERLLVIGESHYGLPQEDTANVTLDTIEKWRSGDANLKYFTNLACLLSCKAAGEIDRTTAFIGIAFYNYVQHLFSVDNKEQPGEALWAAAQDPFLEVVHELDPTHILVTSLRVYNEMPDPLAKRDELLSCKSRLVCEYPTRSGRALAIAIPHLSRVPVANWAPVVAAFRQMPPL